MQARDILLQERARTDLTHSNASDLRQDPNIGAVDATLQAILVELRYANDLLTEVLAPRAVVITSSEQAWP